MYTIYLFVIMCIISDNLSHDYWISVFKKPQMFIHGSFEYKEIPSFLMYLHFNVLLSNENTPQTFSENWKSVKTIRSHVMYLCIDIYWSCYKDNQIQKEKNLTKNRPIFYLISIEFVLSDWYEVAIQFIRNICLTIRAQRIQAIERRYSHML